MRIASIKKIPIEIHYSLILLLLLLFFLELASSGLYSTITYGYFIAIIFASVMLHEIGHALAARKFGIKTRKIILFPLGGVALIEKTNMSAKEEFFISIAGPAVNIGIATLALIPALISDSVFVYSIVLVNIVMGAFNLIPAYPMDGGRVLRSGLSVFLSYEVSTKISVTLSLIICSSLIILGIIYGWISFIIIGLLLIAYNYNQMRLFFKKERLNV